MDRILIVGKNNKVSRSAFRATNASGLLPDAGHAAELQFHRTGATTRGFSGSVPTSPSLTPKVPAGGTSLAEKVIDVVTVMGGLAVFSMIAMFLLVIQ